MTKGDRNGNDRLSPFGEGSAVYEVHLEAVCDDACLHKINHAVREHLRMDPKLMLIKEPVEHSIRNVSD